MNTYARHMDGECPTCPDCARGNACSEVLHECTCPTLPIDTEDQP